MYHCEGGPHKDTLRSLAERGVLFVSRLHQTCVLLVAIATGVLAAELDNVVGMGVSEPRLLLD